MDLNYLAILDTETTAIHPKDGQIIEIAAALYHVPTRSIMHQASTLMRASGNAAESINRISPKTLQSIKAPLSLESLTYLQHLIGQADAIVAHNAEFDRNWITHFTVNNFDTIATRKPWICTLKDFDWSDISPGSQSLVNIAINMGVPVTSAHRALTDCHLLAEIFTRLPDLEMRLNASILPKSNYMALVSYDDRQLAKDAGFTWNNTERRWEKALTQEQYEHIAGQGLFKVVALKADYATA